MSVQGINTRAVERRIQASGHSHVIVKAADDRAQANAAVANRVQANQPVARRVTTQAVSNRVQPNQAVANRVNIAA